jgi:polysaccharide export outer membrane protein
MNRIALVALNALVAGAFVAGCASFKIPNNPVNQEAFRPAQKAEQASFPDKQVLAEFEADSDPIYVLGEGDHVNIQVWGRPELSGKHILGPDGRISMPLTGTLRLAALTREDATQSVNQALRKFYSAPAVSLQVEQYVSNRITVLGRVQNPGALNFDKTPTILEVLARAGALPVIDKQATLTRSAVFRGREKVIWIDLKHLLNRSDPLYNIRLRPNDIVYIPDSNETSVYVLGAVHRPGAYRMTPDMSLLDALSQAGGPNEDASPEEIGLYRPNRQALEKISLKALLTAERKSNYALEEGDVIFVPKSGMAEFGYVLRQFLPGIGFLTFGSALSKPAGK